MSFRTDGFEPSAYTIPPPRPRVMINTGAAHRGPGTFCHSYQHGQSIRYALLARASD